MSRFYSNGIPMLMKGFPTVSDKYNVGGGILEGAANVKFGELVQKGTATGYYKAITTTVELADIAGIALATNVKLNNVYPASANGPEVVVGEAFNLLLDGYVAIELASTAVGTDIVEGASVYVLLANGKFTTANDAGSATLLPGYYFTGMKETHGGVIVAEICVAKDKGGAQ